MYEELYRFLDDQGITHPDDCIALTRERGAFSSDVTPWVADLHHLAVSSTHTAYADLANGSLPASFCLPYDRDRLSPRFLDCRARYSCLLPGASIHVSGSLIEFLKGAGPTEYFVHADFVEQLLNLRPLAELGMAYVVPWRTAQYDGDISTSHFFPDVTQNNSMIHLDRPDAEELPGVFSMPIIEAVDLKRFVDVIQKNRSLFDRHRLGFQRQLADGHAEDAVSDWVRDQQTNVLDIQNAFEQAAAELASKGIPAVIGLCVTAFSLLAPDMGQGLHSAVAALGGGTSVASGIGWLKSMRDLPLRFKDKASWLVWRSLDTKKLREPEGPGYVASRRT